MRGSAFIPFGIERCFVFSQAPSVFTLHCGKIFLNKAFIWISEQYFNHQWCDLFFHNSLFHPLSLCVLHHCKNATALE